MNFSTRIKAIVLTAILAVGLFTALPALIPNASAVDAGNSADGSLSNFTKTYARNEYVEAQPSDCYVFSASVSLTNLADDGKAGLNAGSNILPHNMDFLYDNSRKELATYATLYNADRRLDLGYRYMLTDSTGTELSLTVLRNGKMFYFLNNGELVQMRELDIKPTVPGFTVYNGEIEYTDVYYSADKSEVEEMISQCVPGNQLTLGQEYANFNAYNVGEDGTLTLDSRCVDKPFEYSRVGLKGVYEGDVEISFTTSQLKVNAANDTAGDLWPKLALMVYNDNGYSDMICYGAGRKQDRIETYMVNEFYQWYNHGDLTGNTDINDTLDRNGDIQFRIYVSNTVSTKTYFVYVNGELVATRTSTSYGPVSFGFASEYVSGIIKNITVTEVN